MSRNDEERESTNDRHATVLAAMVAVEDHAFRHPSIPQRHLQGVNELLWHAALTAQADSDRSCG